MREGLAELYENEEQWSKAAQMLSGIDLESGIRYVFRFFFNLKPKLMIGICMGHDAWDTVDWIESGLEVASPDTVPQCVQDA